MDSRKKMSIFLNSAIHLVMVMKVSSFSHPIPPLTFTVPSRMSIWVKYIYAALCITMRAR